MLLFAGFIVLVVRALSQQSSGPRALEHISSRLADLFAQELHGGLGGRPVSFSGERTVESGDAVTLSRFEMDTNVRLPFALNKPAARGTTPRAALLDALGVRGRFAIKGAGREPFILATLSEDFVAALLAATADGLWDEVCTGVDDALVFVWRSEEVMTWGAFEERVPALVEAARAVVAHAQPSASAAEALRARARSRTDAVEVRWRSARALLTSYPDSEAALRLVTELDELHEVVQAACVVWAADVQLDTLSRYSLLRRAVSNASPELAAAAEAYIRDHLAWTCLTDRKVDPKLRRAVAARALGSADAPMQDDRHDAELVALLTDLGIEDLERGELYGALRGSGWLPSPGARLEIARSSGRWMREAMIDEITARGPAFEDRDALLELMKGGVHDAIAPLLEALRRDGHLGSGQLSVAEPAEHQGALSQVGQRGELSQAAGSGTRGGLTGAEEVSDG